MAAITRRPPTSLTLLLLLPLLLVSASALENQAPSSLDAGSTCLTTPYPDVCQQTTSLLSPADSQDPSKLAREVFVLGLESAKTASSLVKATDHPASPLHNCAKSMADCVDVLTRAVEELDGLAQGKPPRSRQYDVSVGKVVAFATTAVTDAHACLQLASEVQTGAVVPDAAVEAMRHTMQLASVGVVFAKRMNGNAPKQNADVPYRLH